MSFGVPFRGRQQACFGIYVHVPFCAGVCSYCDFLKTGRFSRGDVEAFFEALEKSLVRALEALPTPEPRVCTLYFGGGTPGMFPAQRLAPLIARVRARFQVEECTVECNPVGASRARFEALLAAGADRITLGVQSLCPEVLRILGRRHSPTQALAAVRMAREAGFRQVQADLIFGLKPGLRTASVEAEVNALAEAGATGISAYALTLEPRTRLWQSGISDDENAAAEYPRLRGACEAQGFARNETANFSVFEAKHNNIYWHGWPYLGLGTGAHGLEFPTEEHPWGRRYRVGVTPQERAPGDDLLPFASGCEPFFEPHYEGLRTSAEVLSELVFTLLRTPGGIPWDWACALMATISRGETRTPQEVQREVLRALSSDGKVVRAREEGRLACDEEGVRLLGDEFLLGDGWAAHILKILEQLVGR